MAFHLIGTACLVATMSGFQHDATGKPIPPMCREIKSTVDYATYPQCVAVVNDRAAHASEIPAIPDGFKWYTLHCIQEN